MDKAQHDYEVIFIDVGQGDATIIHKLPNMHAVLIDAAVGNTVLSILRETDKLQAIFVTHWDKDHIGGMPAVINWLSNQNQKEVKVFINLQDTSTKIAKTFGRTLDEAWENGTIKLKPVCNDSRDPIAVINGKFLILWPPYAKVIRYPDDRNFGSLILRFEVGVFSLLFGGDAKGDVWPRVDQTALKADVFRYPHHGGELFTGKNSWSADELITKVNPAWIVVSVGANNPHGHPSKEFNEAKLKNHHRRFLSTIEGNVNLQIESFTGNIRIRE